MLFSMILDRTKKGVIYLGGREGVHRSEDGGATWGTLNTGLATLNIRSLVQINDALLRTIEDHRKQHLVLQGLSDPYPNPPAIRCLIESG